MKYNYQKEFKKKGAVPIRGQSPCGFTLIEFILAIALSGIIFLAIAQITLIANQSWDVANSGSNLISQTQTAFDRMARDIRRLNASEPSLLIAQANDIKFIDTWGSTIEYKLQSGALMRNNYTAMENVTSLSFEYLDKNGALIAYPVLFPSYTNVRAVRMMLTANYNNQILTTRTLVKLRNLKS